MTAAVERSGRMLLGAGVDAATAEFSPDRVHRYALTRTWDAGTLPVLFCMLNPSTAGACSDDATVRRVVGYGRRWGAGGAIVVNLYALISTDPAGLRSHPDPVGPGNDEAILSWTQRPLLAAVAAWGAHVAAAPGGAARAARVTEMVCWSGHRLRCLAVTAGGHPGHPLRLPRDAPLTPWPPP